MLLYKDFLININKTCVFAFDFNIYTKNSIINAIKNVKYALIYANLFIANKDDNSKKEVISFCTIALITSIIKKYINRILNLSS